MSKARDLADLAKNANDRLDDVATSDGALSNRNLIINGAANVNQRNQTVTTTGAYGPDRFLHEFGGGLTTSFQQGSVASGTTPYEKGFRKTFKATNTTTSTADGRYAQIEYRFEGQDLNGSGWNYIDTNSHVTLSFWAKSSVSGTYSLFMDDSSFTNRISSSFTLTANTWTKVVKTISGASIVSFSNDNTKQARIVIVLSYGATYTTSNHTNDTWAASNGSSYVPDESHGWNNTASATFEITGVSLEVGDTATPFEHRSISDELARCQRYYEVISRTTSNSTYGTLWSQPLNTFSNCWTNVEYKVSKRAVPSFGLFSGVSWSGSTPDAFPTVDALVLHAAGYYYILGRSPGDPQAYLDAEL